MQKFVCSTAFWNGYDERRTLPGDLSFIEDNNCHSEDGKVPALREALLPYGVFYDFSFTEFAPTLDWDKLKPGDRVFVWRAGGIGDIVQTAPLCHELLDRGAVIIFGMGDNCDLALPIIGGKQAGFSIIRRKQLGVAPPECDWTVTLEGCPEQSLSARHISEVFVTRTRNAPDVLLNPLQRMPGGKYFETARLFVSEWLESEPGEAEQYDLILAPNASAPIRSVTPLEALPEAFLKQYNAAMIGATAFYPATPIPVFNKLPDAELYRTLLSAKLIVCGDSGISHLAYWLGVPMVAFYSVINWRARMYQARHVCVVDCTDLCPMAPCAWHNVICPLLASGGVAVNACSAMLYLDTAKIADLLASRIGRRDGFLCVPGLDLAGLPALIQSQKGIHLPDGTLYEGVNGEHRLIVDSPEQPR